ncbi:hypothetical protein CEP54_003241 [Fusarium duplospermum]|uniref:Uncharacterized protein n=1 Tax=Fusarium duplospermum TaxID=1325734 RepID=A0A428QQ57_9HYPO|nr:hypothetical protein CEP54_003241 [Fusarium duplospermum]
MVAARTGPFGSSDGLPTASSWGSSGASTSVESCICSPRLSSESDLAPVEFSSHPASPHLRIFSAPSLVSAC